MLSREKILEIARRSGKIKSRDIAEQFNVSRQYVSMLLAQLVASSELIKVGSTRSAYYVTPEYLRTHSHALPTRFVGRFNNKDLEEHRVLSSIEDKFPRIKELNEQVKDIFTFAFSEMLNNAIEHSQSRSIVVEVSITKDEVWFIVNDSGVGVFRNVMKKRRLKTELQAIQDLLKGKTTTIPKSHSGEGIFFTSRAADVFILDSFGYQMIVNNKTKDVSAKQVNMRKRGTRVIFRISADSHRHLSEVFKKYTNLTEESDYGFDKTEIRVRLYTMGGVHISRSQARRLLHGLEKFKIVLLDFDQVSMIGQAFADEVYRVFKNKHPDIEIQEENVNEAVRFMIDRAKTEAKRSENH